MRGYVKKLISDKGYGFIKNKDLNQEWFFHRSGMLDGPSAFDSLREGDKVEFDVENSDKGPRAVKVVEL